MNDPFSRSYSTSLRTTARHNRQKRNQQLNYASIEALDPGTTFGPNINSRTSTRSAQKRFTVNFFTDATRDSLKRLGQSIAILVAIFLLIMMTVATWKGSALTGNLGLELFSMTLVTVLLFVFSYLTASYISNKSFVFLVIVLLAIALIKVFLILSYKIGPTSDYWNYHYFAYAKASGIPWTQSLIGVNSNWPHVLNIALLYSIPYSLIGTNFITSQLLNIAITFFDGLLIYKLCASVVNKQAGIFAAMIFSFIPAYFLYGILNGAEPMFLTFVLGLLVTFDTFMKRNSQTSNIRWLTSVVSMFLLSVLAYMVRPTIAIWLVAGLLFLIFRRNEEPDAKKFLWKRYSYFLGFFAIFMVFSALSPNIYSAIYHLPIGSTSNQNKYSLATGTSPQTNGAYNSDIYQIMNNNFKKYKDPNLRDRHVDQQLNAQIHNNIEELQRKESWSSFIDKKYTLFSSEDYGYNWLLYNTYKNNRHAKTFYNMRKPLIALSVIFFEFILILSIFAMSFILLFAPAFKNGIELQNKLFYLALLLDGFILGSMLFEVQGRYHAILYIPLVLILGMGVKILTERRNKFKIVLTI
ncbi:glycosyltransferase family 39 protein [Companilactobacillus furfuricola]|uniref:glycosyltransferase family 39 protein n=1 Tax=Companilactobacillus furfuricola TaxID=1462575 RepID=UPI000F76C9DB|nr:glycosyltransferase family 39 protein [Companilactobacillus furfuricola]